ncbi:MAG: DUF1016 family protein [Flavobacteriales bacterium]|jgi:predicted nuclease of restriction endonuclease-like (RecB) superfamily|nr:DUF1016 family protein [Flavobacteriales bacterium]MBK7941911.1 DUF1016 family protein [Flavobacteriales bacterium]MBK9700455.1 DUF1016 family protein [Flavobacteriales bacterium]
MARSKSPSATAYRDLLRALQERIDSAKLNAARAVNHELVLLYWDLGRSILEKQRSEGWGESVVERLSRDLRKRYPGTTGFSPRNLWDMRRFHETWSRNAILRQAVAELSEPFLNTPRGLAKAPESPVRSGGKQTLAILRQLVAEIPWGHHVLILNKARNDEDLLWYTKAARQYGWSRNVLLNQINGNARTRSVKAAKRHNFDQALSRELALQADEALKSTYNLEFLGVSQVMNERDLETRLIEHIRDFILELGYGFCFVGQQHRLTLGRKEYFIDLLFYHRFLRSLVAIDIKVNEFEPEHAGKMDFYLNLLNDRERGADDAPSIGIILCAENDDLEVEYSLRAKNNPIGVASYSLLHDLPTRYKGKLPTARQLKQALSQALLEQGPSADPKTRRISRRKPSTRAR